MKNAEDLLYLKSILDAISAVSNYRERESENMREDAIIYRIATIGEAGSQISQAIRTQYPAIPWRKIIDCRNVLIHNYLGVEQEVINGIINNDLPQLRKDIEQIIADMENK